MEEHDHLSDSSYDLLKKRVPSFKIRKPSTLSKNSAPEKLSFLNNFIKDKNSKSSPRDICKINYSLTERRSTNLVIIKKGNK